MDISKRAQLLERLEKLSPEETAELFKIEELEPRLEMMMQPIGSCNCPGGCPDSGCGPPPPIIEIENALCVDVGCW